MYRGMLTIEERRSTEARVIREVAAEFAGRSRARGCTVMADQQIAEGDAKAAAVEAMTDDEYEAYRAAKEVLTLIDFNIPPVQPKPVAYETLPQAA